jgi:hypothetical protein
VEESDEGREAGPSQDAKIIGARVSALVDDASRLGVNDCVLSPADLMHEPGSQRNIIAPCLDDLTDGAAGQGLPEFERGDVGRHVIHPWPHVGVDREDEILHQTLTCLQGRQVTLDELEGLGGR